MRHLKSWMNKLKQAKIHDTIIETGVLYCLLADIAYTENIYC